MKIVRVSNKQHEKSVRTKQKIVRTPGIAPRCGFTKKGLSCVRRAQHTGAHSYKLKARIGSSLRIPSRAAKLTCLEMVEDPLYRKQLLLDLRARRVRPAVECMLWYYAKGKPKELVEHSGTLSLQQELSALTDEQLRQRALDVAAMLKGSTVH
jgi:hypothetical protein